MCSTLLGRSYSHYVRLCSSHAVNKFSLFHIYQTLSWTNSHSPPFWVHLSFYLVHNMKSLQHVTLAFGARHFDRHAFTILWRCPQSYTWFCSCYLNRSNQHRIYLPAVWWISFTHKRPERGCSLYRWTTFLQNKSLRFLCVCGACASDIPVAADFSLSRSLLS